MTPRAIIEKEKRRLDDDPQFTVFRWIVGATKIVVYFLLGYFAVHGMDFMMDYRKDHAALNDAVMGVKYNADINHIQDLKIGNHETRIGVLEKLEGQ